MPLGTGYQLPKIGSNPMQPQGSTGPRENNIFGAASARFQQFSPRSQVASFQKQATQQAADPNSDPMQNFYNSQQLYDMTQSNKAAEEAKKAALQKQFMEQYMPQGGGYGQ